MDAVDECIGAALYSYNIQDLSMLLDEEQSNNNNSSSVNPKLKALITSIVAAKLEVWREAAIANRVSLPKYVDMNWAIHLKRASSEVNNTPFFNYTIL